jgi:hypothetical protein
MFRAALAIVAALVAWAAVATLLNFGVRAAIPGYHAVEQSFVFTLPMMIARLALAVAASLAAGIVARTIAPASRYAPLVAGAILLVLFVPVHIQIGARLPLWYHLFFLVTLVPFVLLGARLKARA